MADIPINPVTRRVEFTGNTGTGPFAFTFNVLAQADIAAYKNNTLLALTSDYTVSLNSNGTGSITLTSALISTDELVIIGDLPLSRTTDFVTAGDLLASSLNEQFDSNVVMSQQLDERFDRTIRSQPGDINKNLYLPLVDDRVSQLLSFDSSGNITTTNLSNVPDIGTVNLTVSGLASFADGSLGAPSITNIGDTNTGIYFPAADQLAFTAGGNDIFSITSTYGLMSKPLYFSDGILLTDNSATALTIKEGSNNYLTFVTTNGSEKLSFGKPIDVTGAITTNTSLNIASSTTVTGILDEDNMASNSATKLATQQSIKAYVDAQVGTVDTLAEVLGNGNTTGGTNIVVSANDVISLDDGTNALPSLTTTGDLNTGLYFPAADEVGITTGGTQRVKVDSTGVDITGTVTATGTSVFASLDISGDIDVDGTTNLDATNIVGALDVTGTITSDGLTVEGNSGGGGGSTTPVVSIISDTDTGSSWVGGDIFAATDYKSADGSGVGSGVRVRTGIAQEASAGGSSSYIVQTAPTTAGTMIDRLKISSGGDISFYDTSGNAAFFWDASAESLGIGTSSPQRTLHVHDDSTYIQITNDTTGTTSSDGFRMGYFTGQTIFTMNQQENEGFAFSTNNTERMRIDSSGNVGIGVTPDGSDWNASSTLLHLYQNSTNGALLKLESSNTSVIVAAGNNQFQIGTIEAKPFQFYTSGSERMRIASDGSVGIGTSSPSTKLDVNGDGLAIRIDGTANTSRGILLRSTGTAEGQIQTDGNMHFIQEDAGKYMRFSTANTERMRIDSSGNLLVGTTNTSLQSQSSNTGFRVTTSGTIQSAATSDVSFFNRLATDGDIIRLQKDGSTVGRIRTGGSSIMIGNGNTGLFFDNTNDNIRAVDVSTGSSRDNAVDLGESSTRVKDLYLSGGVYLGGTGSANKLDDYEEGTWTPATYGASTATISSVEGLYTKIGNMVYASFTFNVDTNSDSAHLRIHGLPFTVGSSQAARGGVIIGYQNSGTACVGNGVNSATRFSFFTLSGSDVLFSTFSNKVLRGVYVYSV